MSLFSPSDRRNVIRNKNDTITPLQERPKPSTLRRTLAMRRRFHS